MIEQSKPTYLFWLMTEHCNLTCSYCCYSSTNVPVLPDRSEELTTAQGRSLVEKAQRFGYKAIVFTGGEPLIRPDLLDLVDFALDHQVGASIYTNGTLVTEEIAREFGKRPLQRVTVSIDSFGDYNEKERGCTQQTIDGLTRLVQYKNPATTIATASVVSRRNYREIPLLVQRLKQMGVDDVVLDHVHLNRHERAYDALNIHDMEHDDQRDLFETMRSAWAKEYGFVRFVDFIERFYAGKPLGITECRAPFTVTIVRANGDVQPCFPRKDLVLGNVKRDEFDVMFDGEVFQKNKEELRCATCLHEFCLCLFKFQLRDAK